MREEGGGIGDEKGRGGQKVWSAIKGGKAEGSGEKIENLVRRRASRNDFLYSINLVDNKATTNDTNEFLVDEYGHNSTLVHRWSCIWPLST